MAVGHLYVSPGGPVCLSDWVYRRLLSAYGGLGAIPEPDSGSGVRGVSSGNWGVWGSEGDVNGPGQAIYELAGNDTV